MAFEFSDCETPSGMSYLRVDASGYIELADGEAMMAKLERPKFIRAKVLSVVAKDTEYSPEVRKFFPSMKDHYGVLAAVVTSPIVRAAINLMVRLANQGEAVRMFKDEATALEWLERQPSMQPEG